jgi:hypothetical protein
MLDIRAYCDESESPAHLVIAGAMATSARWEAFDDDWTTLLRREGLAEFHTHDCAQGVGEYEDRDNTERQRLLRGFLEVVQAHPLNGVGMALDISAWPTIEDVIRQRGAEKLAEPWIFVFGQVVQLMAARCPVNERIAFMFDNNRQYEFRAHQGFGFFQSFDIPLLPKSDAQALRQRLGRLSFDSSERHPGLQAADALAYETRLRLRLDRLPRESWTRTTEQMASMVLAHFEQSSADRIAALNNALVQRGVTVGELTWDELAEILRGLPPINLEHSPRGVLPSLTVGGIADITPASNW